MDDFEDIEPEEASVEEIEPEPDPEKPKSPIRKILVVGAAAIAVLLAVVVLMPESKEPPKRAPEPEPVQYPNQKPGQGNPNSRPAESDEAGQDRPPSNQKQRNSKNRKRKKEYDYDYVPTKPKPLKRQLTPIEKAEKVLNRKVPERYREHPRWLAWWLSKKIRFPVRYSNKTSGEFVAITTYLYTGDAVLRFREKGQGYPTLKLVSVWPKRTP